MTLENFKKRLETLKRENDIQRINEIGKGLEFNLKRGKDVKDRLEVYEEVFGKKQETKQKK